MRVEAGKGGGHALLVLGREVLIGSSGVPGDLVLGVESPETGVGLGRLGLVVDNGDRSSGVETVSELLSLNGLGCVGILSGISSGSGGGLVHDGGRGHDSGGTFGESDCEGDIVLSLGLEGS